MARPSSFTPEIGEIICQKISEDMPLTKVCSEHGIPSIWSVYRWMEMEGPEYDKFRKDYARARKEQADSSYYQIQLIEQKMQLPRKILDKETGEMISNPDYIDPHTGRVLIDSIKWRAGRMKPSKYGEKIDLEVGGNVKIVVQDAYKPEGSGKSG
jgi:hypothetical protein